MISEAGVEKGTADTGLTVATLVNFAVLFSLPVFAIPAILVGPPIAPLLLPAALAGVIGFVAAGIIGGVVLFRDRPLAALGTAVIVSWRGLVALILPHLGPTSSSRVAI